MDRAAPHEGSPRLGDKALLVDLYELTMLQSYWRRGMRHEATFDLFVRDLPPTRRFLVACGLHDAIAYLEELRFTPDALEYLRSIERFDPEFITWLAAFRFTGEVWAMPEGEIAFAAEPLLRVTAPLPESQLVETFLLNTMLHQTGVASKAARCVIAAAGRAVVDFSARRDHGIDAAVKAARSAWIAGAAGTSNVLAGKQHGIPLIGTMAHSYVMAFDDETQAFQAYAEEFPDHSVLLVDTYESKKGIERAAAVGRDLAARGHTLQGIRLDSGDVISLARTARRILDEAGLATAQIFVSGDLNEWRIAEIVSAGAPVDAFGVGTELGVVADAPALGGVYKLAEYAGVGRAKRSHAKGSMPGRKQVWRREDFTDVVERSDVTVSEGRPILEPFMRGGRAVGDPRLADARERCAAGLAALPDGLRELAPRAVDDPPRVLIGASLR